MKTAELYVLEGSDAAGKATQARMLAEYLETRVIAFPRYDTEQGKLIADLLFQRIGFTRRYREMFPETLAAPPVSTRADARALQHAMTYDRYSCRELWEHTGPLVLDRYWMSGWVYGSLDGLDPDELLQVHRGLPRAEFVFLIDVSPSIQMDRLVARGRPIDRYEEKPELLARVGAKYLELWNDARFIEHPHSPLGRHVLSIDGSGTPAEVHERIVKSIIAAKSDQE